VGIPNQERVLRFAGGPGGGYNAISVNPDGTTILVAREDCEVSFEGVAPNVTGIRLMLLSANDLDDTIRPADEFDYYFNEEPTGVPAPVVPGAEGATLRDWGPLGQN